jgi:heterodisulfide reductase subunit A
VGAALVVGGGIGGVMAQLDKTFKTNDCAMCTMAPRLVEIAAKASLKPSTTRCLEPPIG